MQPYLNEVKIYCQNWAEIVCAVRSENLSKNFHLLYGYTLKWSKNHLRIRCIKRHLNTEYFCIWLSDHVRSFFH